MPEATIEKYIRQIVLPESGSHKGQNGRVLVIGGSKLFHSAAFWAASMASKTADLVHFTSPAMENNDLMRVRAKEKFWDGIVIPYEDVRRYIEEDDAILIGPGMPRDDGLMSGEKPTGDIVNMLLRDYPDKKWVVDGGALQEADPSLITSSMVVTPNLRELRILRDKTDTTDARELSQKLNRAIVLAKGTTDVVTDGIEKIEIPGGNAGMTKGGTGDVLAGLVLGLYAKTPAMASAVTAAYVNKTAGERLGRTLGTHYNASDLIPEAARVLTGLIG